MSIPSNYNPRPSFKSANDRPHKPKQKAWSHQRELESARGKKVRFVGPTLGPNLELVGTLLEADPFTFKVQIATVTKPNQIGEPIPSAPIVLHKSSVTYYQVL